MGNELLHQNHRGGRMRPNVPALISWPFTVADDRAQTKGTGHFHWGITAFHEVLDGQFQDAVSIEVEADNEQQAISRAMEILERANYRVSWVREACTTDPQVKGGTDG
jgi:hypothetical protein